MDALPGLLSLPAPTEQTQRAEAGDEKRDCGGERSLRRCTLPADFYIRNKCEAYEVVVIVVASATVIQREHDEISY